MNSNTNLKNNSISDFIMKDVNFSSKKARIISWTSCTILWLLLYGIDNESFAEFFAPLNIFTFSLLTLLITESIIYIHRKVKKKTKSTWSVILSSIAGIGLGIGLTIVVCFSLFWALMYFAFG